MNSKSLSRIVVFASVVIGVMLCNPGCKKDDSGPTTPVGPNAPYGSGTITTQSNVGALSFSGTGLYPLQAGPSVIGIYDTTSSELLILGYQRVSGSNYNLVQVRSWCPVQQGIYSSLFFEFHAGYNVDTLGADTALYDIHIGSLTISSVNGSTVSGTYNLDATKEGQTYYTFTGTFNVTYVVRRLPAPHGIFSWIRS